MKLVRLNLQHFLSYRDATLEMGDLVALVGQNSAGKSNVLKALKLLRDIPHLVCRPPLLAEVVSINYDIVVRAVLMTLVSASSSLIQTPEASHTTS